MDTIKVIISKTIPFDKKEVKFNSKKERVVKFYFLYEDKEYIGIVKNRDAEILAHRITKDLQITLKGDFIIFFFLVNKILFKPFKGLKQNRKEKIKC